MTTSADPASTPADPGASTSELFEIWRAIGRLEGTANSLLEGQSRLESKIDTGLREQRDYTDAGLRELREYFDTAMREQRNYFDAALREHRAYTEAAFQRLAGRIDAGLREQREHTDNVAREQRDYTDSGLREVNRRIDRMFYGMLGVGGALLVAVLATRFIGG